MVTDVHDLDMNLINLRLKAVLDITKIQDVLAYIKDEVSKSKHSKIGARTDRQKLLKALRVVKSE